MKSKLLLLLLCFYFAGLKAQTDSTVTFDQLQVPSSPAFTILGISPNNIERPKNPTDFAFSLGNATSGFTAIPKDYAVEFAPFWIFGKKKATFREFISNTPKNNMAQTFTVSIATTTAKTQIDSSQIRKAGVGLKLSVFRGQPRDEFKKWNDSVSFYLGKASEIMGKKLSDLVSISDKKIRQFRDSAEKARTMNNTLELIRWSDSVRKRSEELIALV